MVVRPSGFRMVVRPSGFRIGGFEKQLNNYKWLIYKSYIGCFVCVFLLVRLLLTEPNFLNAAFLGRASNQS